MGRVSGKVALVTGGVSGIGAASAILLAREGAKVAITDRNEALADEILAAIRAAGGDGLFLRHDVTLEQDWQSVMEATLAAFGRLDIAVNSAGIGVGGNIEDVSYEDFQRVNKVNYDGVFLGTQAAIRAIRQSDGGGSIINISSVFGLVAHGGVPAYNGSKGAVRLLSKSAALYCAKKGYGIRVNTVHPGHIMTPLVANYYNNLPDPEGSWADLLGRYPVGHIGEPDDVAYGVLYLASDEAKFVTGSELVIDGGYTAQ